MAYTKVKAVKNHLARCLKYTANPQKTEAKKALRDALAYAQNEDKTEHQLYVSGFNCDPASAFESMQETKQYWKKDDSDHVCVQAYHVIQSFAPGEVTPQQAHEIGCEFAKRAFADRFEVTVSTHLDRNHLHNHIVFNSVSFVDGKMFRNDFKGYYKGIRAVSDQICREHKLSIITPKQKGKAYTEWQAEKGGAPTVRSMIRADVDRALEQAVSWETFVLGLKRMGYSVKYGRNVKYAAIRHKTGSRNIRLKSLGEGYDEASIRDLLERRKRGEDIVYPRAAREVAEGEQDTDRKPPFTVAAPHRKTYARYRGALPVLPRQKITGFVALYYRYVYLLGITRQRRTSRRCYYLLCEDFRQFDRYQAQFKYVWEHRIQTQNELTAAKNSAKAERDALTAQRKQLYRERGNAKRKGDTDGEAAISEKISALSEQIRARRKEVMICGWVEENAARLQEQITEVERAEQRDREQEKDRKKGGLMR